VLLRGSSCSLAWAMDGCVMHHSIISSCQSSATYKIVKTLLVTSLDSDSCEQLYSKYLTFTFTLTFIGRALLSATGIQKLTNSFM